METNRENAGFFSRTNQLFLGEHVDAQLLAAYDAGRAAIVDARDPAAVLKGMARSDSYNSAEDTALLSRLSTAELVGMFDANAATSRPRC
jgi:hypothetical protein